MTRKETLIYFMLGAVNIASGVAEIAWLNYLTKPLLMISLGIFYFLKTKENLTLQDKIMLIALLFSCFGDTFLMFQGQNPNFFLFGLGSFLVAQISYIFAFRQTSEISFRYRYTFFLYSLIFYFSISKSIPQEFNIPILIYTLCITFMGITASGRETNEKSYQFVLVGAILFIISDSIIAINKFAFDIPFSGFWIMNTYVIAQYLIVEGVLLGRGNNTNT